MFETRRFRHVVNFKRHARRPAPARLCVVRNLKSCGLKIEKKKICYFTGTTRVRRIYIKDDHLEIVVEYYRSDA